MSQAEKSPVLILDAASDIAQALARALAQQGHPIQLAGRSSDKLTSLADDLKIRFSVPVTTHQFDALQTESFNDFFDSFPEFPHIVISAIGLMGDQDGSSGDPEQFKLVINSNFTGPAIALDLAARRLVKLTGLTTLVAISSVAGDRGRARNYIYGAAKAGLTQYMSGLRQKYNGTNVHVMTVKPGFVQTAMTEGMDLPAALTTTPEKLAESVVRAIGKRQPIYYDLRWRGVMGIIKFIPESIFARLKF